MSLKVVSWSKLWGYNSWIQQLVELLALLGVTMGRIHVTCKNYSHHSFNSLCGIYWSCVLISFLFISMQKFWLEEHANMQTSNLSKILHNIWLQKLGKKGAYLYVATLDDYVWTFQQDLYFFIPSCKVIKIEIVQIGMNCNYIGWGSLGI